jgi:hypothetical protein
MKLWRRLCGEIRFVIPPTGQPLHGPVGVAGTSLLELKRMTNRMVAHARVEEVPHIDCYGLVPASSRLSIVA